jgi:hypothetical protein
MIGPAIEGWTVDPLTAGQLSEARFALVALSYGTMHGLAKRGCTGVGV